MTLVERFKKYIAFDTVSDESSLTYPSTKSQVEFAKILVDDLKKLGVKDAYKDEHSIVYAFIDNKKEKTIGLISHMDTAPTIEGGIKNPRLIEKYNGEDIELNLAYKMKVEDFPVLKTVIGEDLLVTDGEHLLGGDDKAGIAIIFDIMILLIGCFIDVSPAILLLTPIMLPVMESYGFSALQFGAMMITGLAIGLVTPPVGMNLFLSSYRFGKPMSEIIKSVIPMLLAAGVTVLLITYIPWLTTWLPQFFKS